jgi:uncharacterized surface protein with fasciclin (FAS1) repeats
LARPSCPFAPTNDAFAKLPAGTVATLLKQLSGYPQALGMSGAVMIVMALLPGIPMLPFLFLGGGAGAIAYVIDKRVKATAAVEARKAEAEAKGPGAVIGIAQYLIEAVLLCLASKERYVQRLRGFDVAWQLGQHRDAAGNVEAADADRQARGDEGPRQVHDARKLVRLHADEAD